MKDTTMDTSPVKLTFKEYVRVCMFLRWMREERERERMLKELREWGQR